MAEKVEELPLSVVRTLITQAREFQEKSHKLLDMAQKNCKHVLEDGKPALAQGFPVPPGDEHCSVCFTPADLIPGWKR